MTREHVIPAFLYDFQKQQQGGVLGWSEPAEKMVGGELKVKDVCGVCNNEILGKLDSYGKSLLTGHGLLVTNFKKEHIDLQYDYDMLTRWLLKISFNSSRTDNVHSPLFEKFIPYMLGTGSRPSRGQLSVICFLARAAEVPVDLRDKPLYVELAGSSGKFNPFIVRIAWAPSSGNYTVRIVILGALVFFMLMFPESVLPGHAASDIRKFLKSQRNTVELTPARRLVNVRQSVDSWLDLYQAQLIRQNSSAVELHRASASDQ
ncbi:hypothetical protein PQQ99_21415 [Paraburkholderia sediminicola]|uniref:DUF4238 domain-containing protein n=1 Tax=Paraburkholderia metrosideri TaxID=580937 RepID=A0ABW9E5P6_9BURK